MCLRAVKEFKKPVKEMIGWKLLSYDGNQYYTPFRTTGVKKNQKFLKAKGCKDIQRDYSDMMKRNLYHGGFIHCYQTRARARYGKEDEQDRVIKVKCYNVRALGTNGDLVCDKIEFLWEQR